MTAIVFNDIILFSTLFVTESSYFSHVFLLEWREAAKFWIFKIQIKLKFLLEIIF